MKKCFSLVFTLLLIFNVPTYAFAELNKTPLETAIQSGVKELKEAANKDRIAQKTIETSGNIAKYTLLSNYPPGSHITSKKEMAGIIDITTAIDSGMEVKLVDGTTLTPEEFNNKEGRNIKGLYNPMDYTAKIIPVDQGLFSWLRDPKVKIVFHQNDILTEKEKREIENSEKLLIDTVQEGYVFNLEKDQFSDTNNLLRKFLVDAKGELVDKLKLRCIQYDDIKGYHYVDVEGYEKVLNQLNSNASCNYGKNKKVKKSNMKLKVSYIKAGDLLLKVVLTEVDQDKLVRAPDLNEGESFDGDEEKVEEEKNIDTDSFLMHQKMKKHLFGTWNVSGDYGQTYNGTLTLSNDTDKEGIIDFGKISGEWKTEKGTFDVKGEVDSQQGSNGTVKLKLFYKSKDHIVNDLKVTPIPADKRDYFATKLYEDKGEYYKLLTFPFPEYAELATLKTYDIKYYKETYKYHSAVSAQNKLKGKILLVKQPKEPKAKGYLSSKDYLYTKDAMYGRYMARAAINEKLIFSNHPFFEGKSATNNEGNEIDNFIAFKIDASGDKNILTYAVTENYNRLSFKLNLSKSTKNTSQTTTFKVYTDGKEVYSTEVQKGYLPEKVDIDLKGVKKIKFELNETDFQNYNYKSTEVILEEPTLY